MARIPRPTAGMPQGSPSQKPAETPDTQINRPQPDALGGTYYRLPALGRAPVPRFADTDFDRFCAPGLVGARGGDGEPHADRYRVVVLGNDRSPKPVDLVRAHLAPLVRSEKIDLWYPSKVLPGKRIADERRLMLNQANLIVPLLDAQFIAWEAEVIDELHAAWRCGAGVMPFLWADCAWDWTALARFCEPLRPDSARSTRDEKARAVAVGVDLWLHVWIANGRPPRRPRWG